MRRIVSEALDAGAVGFATSKAPTHVGYAGRPVPSRAASLDEIRALAGTLTGREHGVLQATIGRGFFLPELAGIQRETGHTVSWTALLAGMFPLEAQKRLLEETAKLHADGVRVVPQVSCRPLVVEFQFKAPFPFESLSIFKPVSEADLLGKKRIYADPSFRQAFRERSEQGVLTGRWADMVITECPGRPELADRDLAGIAAARDVHPADLALDLALASDLEVRFRMPVANTDESAVAELLRDPCTVLGLSDAGAHASQLCDACAPTHLLGHWVRETGTLSVEEGVRQLTSATADHFGLRDRGRLGLGLAGDVTVFDPHTVGCSPLRRVRDFPAGADRLVSDATGIRAVIVEGTPIRIDDQEVVAADGPLPGRVLR
jgi:N-acyl-D-aspartate/D-glutamate deacylase